MLDYICGMDAKELRIKIDKRFQCIEDIMIQLFNDECTIRQALLAMSYIAETGFVDVELRDETGES